MRTDSNSQQSVFTEDDFDSMDWHDAKIRAVALRTNTFEIAFDIDYILKWIHTGDANGTFQFEIAPATLVFENVYNIEFDFTLHAVELTIMSITRKDEHSPRNAQFIGKNSEWLWTIECLSGEIKFRAASFKQYLRENPVLSTRQNLPTDIREISFECGRVS